MHFDGRIQFVSMGAYNALLHLGAQLVDVFNDHVTEAATRLEAARSANDRVPIDSAVLRQALVFRLIGKERYQLFPPADGNLLELELGADLLHLLRPHRAHLLAGDSLHLFAGRIL